MNTDVTSPTGKKQTIESRTLRIVLELEFPEDCPLSDVGSGIADIEVQLTDEGCRANVFQEGAEQRSERVTHQTVEHHRPSHRADWCVCYVFDGHDCIPGFIEARDGRIEIATYPPHQETVSDLVADLREVCESVTLLQMTGSADHCASCVSEVDLSQLSDKQEEALRTAVRAGYFYPGSETTLEDVARHLDISPSALSQRLKRAKQTVFDQLFR